MRSWARPLYLLFGLLLLGGWGYLAVTGTEWGSPARQSLPPDVRSSPGGYRTFHFWHDGYHGGK
jgi:hypothetical protein